MKEIKEILDYMGLEIAKEERNDFILFCPTHIHGKESDKPHLWINKETGVCHCFACGFKAKIQDFVKAFYGDITDEEVEDICGTGKTSVLTPINIKFVTLEAEQEEKKVYDFNKYWGSKDHSYLLGRGISEEIINTFQCGFDKEYNAVFIPLKDLNGEFIGYKTRSVKTKRFFNAKDMDLSKFLFGAFLIRERHCEKVTIVESEIDAMYLWSCGIPAIACMGKSFSEEKANLLASLGIQHIEIFTDFDEAGILLAQEIIRRMKGKCFSIYRTQQPNPNVKDANDMTKEEIKRRKVKRIY